MGLTIAGFAYAAVTGLTLYASGHVTRRVSAATAAVLEKIAVTLPAGGGTRLVTDILDSL